MWPKFKVEKEVINERKKKEGIIQMNELNFLHYSKFFLFISKKEVDM